MTRAHASLAGAPVALVQDHVVQRGGAERVLLEMARSVPHSAIYTSFFEPADTYPEYAAVDVRPMFWNRVGALRHRHRAALPLLAASFDRLRLDHELVVCASAGLSHRVSAAGRKIIYWYSPARWLYQRHLYLRRGALAQRAGAAVLSPYLLRSDRRAALDADHHVAISTEIANRLRAVYGVEAEILHPAHGIRETEPLEAPRGVVDDGFFLVISRLLPYKNVQAVVEAFRGLPSARVVIVGDGPGRQAILDDLPPNVTLLSAIPDAQLRWLYARCRALVAASYEDLGLTPLEAAAFGRPSVVLRWGGFLDTVIEDQTGVFFDTPTPAAIAEAIGRCDRASWSEAALRQQAERFGRDAFDAKFRTLVSNQLALARGR